MKKEEWRDIPDHPHYQVSSLGRARSLDRHLPPPANRFQKGRILIQHKTMSGYCFFVPGLRKRSLSTHRLVCAIFCTPGGPNQNQVNHKNGIKTDNRAKNLEWCSSKENMAHAKDIGLCMERDKNRLGSKNARAIVNESDVIKIRSAFKKRPKNVTAITYCAQLGKQFGLTFHGVQSIVYRVSWKHI